MVCILIIMKGGDSCFRLLASLEGCSCLLIHFVAHLFCFDAVVL